DLNVQKLEEELKARQNQSEQIGQDARKEAEARAAAAQRIGELEQQLHVLREERAAIESRLNEQTGVVAAQVNEQLAAMQAELESERKLVQDLAAESSRVKAEYTELQQSAESERGHRSSLETLVEQEREQVR